MVTLQDLRFADCAVSAVASADLSIFAEVTATFALPIAFPVKVRTRLSVSQALSVPLPVMVSVPFSSVTAASVLIPLYASFSASYCTIRKYALYAVSVLCVSDNVTSTSLPIPTLLSALADMVYAPAELPADCQARIG